MKSFICSLSFVSLFSAAIMILPQVAYSADQLGIHKQGVSSSCRQAIYAEAMGLYLRNHDVSNTGLIFYGLTVAGYDDNHIGVKIGLASQPRFMEEVAVTFDIGSSNMNLLNCAVVPGLAF